MFVLSIFAGTFQAVVQVYHFHLQHNWVPAAMVAEIRGTLSPEEEAWCKTPSPLTEGICFLPEPDRIKAVDFIESNTLPGQKLFVGAGRHDRIFANDNMTYFATQRIPVTHWQHFDPFLQDTPAIQSQMIQELDADKTPYIVVDSEYDDIHEPNESDRSTGVLLLDNYIHQRYRRVETFGFMSIWQRIQQ